MQRIKQVLLFIWQLPTIIESKMSHDRTTARILFIANIPALAMIPAKCIEGIHISNLELVLWCIVLLYQFHWYKCLDLPWQRKKEDHGD